MIAVSYDDSNGVIRTVTYGTTSRAEMEDYLNRLMEHIEDSRLQWGCVRHLVDASQLVIQSDENLKCLAGAGVEIQQGNDKTAVVMSSLPAIAQLETMPSHYGTLVFPNFAAAKEWLFAEEGKVEYLEGVGELI
ncbi:MAG: hypothetical protein EOP17_00310 [Rhizobiaceae bacterium]|nr:MAG: hypothetical protein EOP17_00310 [Rhizobiaceae bacterium]